MRNKILAELVKKFPGLPKQFLGLLSDKLAKKVTEESGIESAITDFDNAVSIKELATEFQKEGDRRVTEGKKEWEKNHPTKSKTEDEDEEDEEDENEEETVSTKKSTDTSTKKKTSDRVPKYIKELQGSLKTISEELGTLKKEKQANNINEKIKSHEKMKDIPEDFYEDYVKPEKEEDVDAFAEKVSTKYSTYKQIEKNEKAKGLTKPVSSAADTKGQADVKEVDAILDNIMPGTKAPAAASK